jgi:hypothetical protein
MCALNGPRSMHAGPAEHSLAPGTTSITPFPPHPALPRGPHLTSPAPCAVHAPPTAVSFLHACRGHLLHACRTGACRGLPHPWARPPTLRAVLSLHALSRPRSAGGCSNSSLLKMVSFSRRRTVERVASSLSSASVTYLREWWWRACVRVGRGRGACGCEASAGGGHVLAQG